MTNLQLDWTTAEVSDGKLTVSLDEKPSDEWCATFERTEQLLNHGTWPQISLKKRAIVVGEVEAGSEEKLRFFLESVVQEANAAQAADEEDPEAADSAEGDGDEGAESEEEGDDTAESNPDSEMTDRFRSFAS